MIIQGGVDSQGTQHTLSNAAKVWAITTGAINTTVTLPPIAENYGNYIDVMKADAGAGYVTADGNGAETINGVASIVIEKQYCGLRLYGAASEWIVAGTIGECEIQTIGAEIELVYIKQIFGASLAASPTVIAHGITISKVLSLKGFLSNTSSSHQFDMGSADFWFNLDATNLTITHHSSYSSYPYRVEIKYYI
jgi:hypothetical protein